MGQRTERINPAGDTFTPPEGHPIRDTLSKSFSGDRYREALYELQRWQPHTEVGLAGLHPQHRAAVEAARAALR